MHGATRDAKPTHVIGIETDRNEFETLSREAGTIVADYGLCALHLSERLQ
jgi:hypothetical protein